MSTAEQRVLRVFRDFMVTPGQMLCFGAPDMKRFGSALRQLTEKKFIEKEQFKGAYSLTDAGFAAMKDCS